MPRIYYNTNPHLPVYRLTYPDVFPEEDYKAIKKAIKENPEFEFDVLKDRSRDIMVLKALTILSVTGVLISIIYLGNGGSPFFIVISAVLFFLLTVILRDTINSQKMNHLQNAKNEKLKELILISNNYWSFSNKYEDEFHPFFSAEKQRELLLNKMQARESNPAEVFDAILSRINDKTKQ